jgi:phenylalanyl-tRNA synthetase alpha chain
VGCTICRRWERSEVSTTALPCRVCKDTGFIEVLGCGMIHPVVFEQVGYDAERYTGFAFGLGIDRVAMLRYGIPHLSLLYGNDPRFLNQF